MTLEANDSTYLESAGIAIQFKTLAIKDRSILKLHLNQSDLQFFKSLILFMESFSSIERLKIRGEIQNILNKLQSRQP